jgi:23S rRNA (cytosine1962-C5)-methyltransferase
VLPCLIFEDEHLLVVNKPAGLNTHAPSPYAGEGIYEWLRHREPRWATLAIIHRLDKETSGVMVFAKTQLANRSLTEQFTRRAVQKRYLLVTDRPIPHQPLTVRSELVRVGDKYRSSTPPISGEKAETRFEPFVQAPGLATIAGSNGLKLLTAVPLTGRTHQIRVHAAERGFPILGDTLYGGTSAARVFLHANEIVFAHPGSGEKVTFQAPADFQVEPRLALRASLVDPALTNAYRLEHGGSDRRPGWFIDRLGSYLLAQTEQSLTPADRTDLETLMRRCLSHGAYHKALTRQVRTTKPTQVSPQLICGHAAPDRFSILENGLRFELSFGEGYSAGLFLDQRENRRRLLTGHIAAGFTVSPSTHPRVLNAFAYTCGFSVAAARGGFHTTSLDLSRKYLEWGKRNFQLNDLDPDRHDFIYGDVFSWLRRFSRKERTFDLILLDPPTFSQSKESGLFRAERDYPRLIASTLQVLAPGGVLFVSTNAADWRPEAFVADVEQAVRGGGKEIVQRHYVPQPPDFPASRAQPAYLKTAWLQVEGPSRSHR